MSAAFAAELELLVRARYPLIHIVTAEELRAQELIAALAERRGKKVYEWSNSTGLVPGGTNLQSRKSHAAATRDPLAAVDVILEQVEPALFVFNGTSTDFQHSEMRFSP